VPALNLNAGKIDVELGTRVAPHLSWFDDLVATVARRWSMWRLHALASVANRHVKTGEGTVSKQAVAHGCRFAETRRLQ